MPRAIRVLHVITEMGFGGAERLVVSAATRLPAAQFESVVCCLADAGPLADEAAARGVPVVCIGGFPGLRHPWRFGSLVAQIRRIAPDVVHTHLQSPNLYGRLAALIAGVPVIVATEHNVYASKRRRYIAVERLLARRSSALIAVSDEVRRVLAAQLRMDPSSIVVIRNGVAAPVPSEASVAELRQRLALPSDHVIFGAVASLTPKKGHEVLLRALATLDGTAAKFVLLVAGAGPERSRLEQLAAALGVSDRVRFLGAVNRPADVLALTDVFVLPSLVEGMPLALLEAMRAGKAVVATAVGGVPEVVASDVNGLLVPAGDPQALAEALRRIVSSRGLRDALAERARAVADVDFTEEQYVESLGRLYAKLASASI